MYNIKNCKSQDNDKIRNDLMSTDRLPIFFLIKIMKPLKVIFFNYFGQTTS
jgi:hypothetical protein